MSPLTSALVRAVHILAACFWLGTVLLNATELAALLLALSPVTMAGARFL